MASKKDLENDFEILDENGNKRKIKAKRAEEFENKKLEEKTKQPETIHLKENSKKEDCNCKKNLAKMEEYKNLLQVTMADFDNYRKHSLKMRNDARVDGELNVIKKFLPALDSFNKAEKMISDKNILKGVKMIENEIKNSLNQIGVKEMKALGEKFNPEFHNAISVSDNPEIEDDVITDVFEKGYIYKDKVIRYAQVIINKQNKKGEKI